MSLTKLQPRTADLDVRGLLELILQELRILNLHLQDMTQLSITADDIN